MATHFCILAWEVPWTEEPGRLQLMESQSWYNHATEHTCGSRSEGKTAGLASLDNSSWLWGIAAVLSCLVPGLGLLQGLVYELDKENGPVYMKRKL